MQNNHQIELDYALPSILKSWSGCLWFSSFFAPLKDELSDKFEDDGNVIHVVKTRLCGHNKSMGKASMHLFCTSVKLYRLMGIVWDNRDVYRTCLCTLCVNFFNLENTSFLTNVPYSLTIPRRIWLNLIVLSLLFPGIWSGDLAIFSSLINSKHVFTIALLKQTCILPARQL